MLQLSHQVWQYSYHKLLDGKTFVTSEEYKKGRSMIYQHYQAFELQGPESQVTELRGRYCVFKGKTLLPQFFT